MNEDVLIPEVHDIFKLTQYGHINTTALDSKISENIISQLSKNKTTEGILKHHISDRFRHFPDTPETIILCIADTMAASFSRISIKEGKPIHNVQKLWKCCTSSDTEFKFIPPEDIIEFLNTKDSISYYNKPLRTRSEDASATRAITSLYTHLILTGKFYRILFQIDELKNEIKEVHNFEEAEHCIKEIQKRIKLVILKIKFKFPQQPVRAMDLNVYIYLEQFLQEIKQKFSDNILLSTSEELLLITNKEVDQLLANFKSISKGVNFYAEIVWAKRPMEELNPNPEDTRGCRAEYFYLTDIPDKISIPVCPICRMSPASEKWQRSEEPEMSEQICSSCFKFRNMGARLPKLSDWESKGDSNLLWIKIDLDFSILYGFLNALYKDYLSELQKNNLLSSDFINNPPKIRFSVISEFQEDYTGFSNCLREKLIEQFKEENVQQILTNFFCIKINKKIKIWDGLKIYEELIKAYFPKFLECEDNSPIMLKMIYSYIKFPFFEIWSLLNEMKEDINIYLIGHGKLTTKIKFLSNIMHASTYEYNKSALYKLAQISKIYKTLANLEFNDGRDKENSYKLLGENLLPLGMDFQSILTFAELLEE